LLPSAARRSAILRVGPTREGQAMIETVRPASWLELLSALDEGSWNETIGRFRSPYAFRGHALTTEDLSSGLTRLAAGRSDVARLEIHLLRNFRKYAYGQTGVSSMWQWLALAQHRGLPTRLLDWTYSPLVALHFTTANLASMDRDGCVWAIDYVGANRFLPARLRRMLRDEGSDTATVDMLRRFGSLRAFDRLARAPFVVFLEPPSVDPRIVNQFALFSLMPGPGLSLDDWLQAHPQLARRIVVPASLKWEIRDRLDQANVNERVLFPGLDGLSRWLTRYYWPKPGGRSRSRRIRGQKAAGKSKRR
jgi:FRG domain-containing protein